MDWRFQFATELLGTAPQIRVVDTTPNPRVDYDITIPAGLYWFASTSSVGPVKAIVNELNTLIAAAGPTCTVAVEGAGAGRRVLFDDKGGQYLLRLLNCVDNEHVALALGLYGDNYDPAHYISVNALATWCVSAATWWVASGYDHLTRDQAGFPDWSADHRVTEGGRAAHIAQVRRAVLPLVLTSVPGAALRGVWTDGAYGSSATDSVSLWRAYDPALREPLVHVTCGSRWSGAYWLRAPLTAGDASRLFDRWSGFYRLQLQLGPANV